MIFLRDKSNKFHIADIFMKIDNCYHGKIYDWQPITPGRPYYRKEQLPDRISLCGLCLVRYSERKSK